MREEPITIAKGPHQLEGVLNRAGGSRGLIMAHPHPLYGGDMNNPVVTAVTRTFAEAGYTTLRFNFRGVGASRGEFADGRGEVEDLLAARDYLSDSGIRKITLAGYSFGAWVIVNAAAAGKLETEPLILISPPAAMLPFAASLKLPGLMQIITGARDEIAPPQPVKTLQESWNQNAELAIIKDCDHFFGGHLHEITAIISHLLNRNDR